MSQSVAPTTRKIVHIVPRADVLTDAVDRLDFDNAPINFIDLPA